MIALSGNTLLTLGSLLAFIAAVWQVVQSFEWKFFVLFCVFCAYAILFAIWFWKQNEEILRPASHTDRPISHYAWRSTKVWSVLLAALLLGTAANHLLQMQVLMRFYESGFIIKNPMKDGEITWYWDSRDQQDDLNYSNELLWGVKKKEAAKRIDDTRVALLSSANALPEGTRKLAADSIPPQILDPGRCRRLIRFICSMIDGFYRDWRSDEIIDAELWGRARAATYRQNEVAQFEELKKHTLASLEAGQSWAARSIRWTFTLLSFLGLFSLLMMSFALCKSFAYIFARIFLTETGKLVGLGRRRGPIGQGAKMSARRPNSYRLPARDGHVFYIKPSISTSGAYESKKIYQPMQLALSRIRHGIWMMNRCEPDDNNEITIEIDQADSLVVLPVNGENDEWLLDLRNVVAFTEGVTFKTYLSVKIISVVFGRLMHVGVSGAGQVILAVQGGASIAERGDIFPQSQMIAWKRNARFEIGSSLSRTDIYLSKVSVSPTTSDACVKDLGAISRKERLLLRVLGLVISPV